MRWLAIVVLALGLVGCQTPSVGLVPGKGVAFQFCWDPADSKYPAVAKWTGGLATMTDALMGCVSEDE